MLPSVKTENIISQEIESELLLYDMENHKALNLNQTSSIIYKACRDRMSAKHLKNIYGIGEDTIFLAIEQFEKESLLVEKNFNRKENKGLSRRAIIGTSLVALPMITGLVAPSALMAASTAVCGNGITEPPEQCDDGNRLTGDGCSAVCEIEPL